MSRIEKIEKKVTDHFWIGGVLYERDFLVSDGEGGLVHWSLIYESERVCTEHDPSDFPQAPAASVQSESPPSGGQWSSRDTGLGDSGD